MTDNEYDWMSIPDEPGFYRGTGYDDWLRTREGVWIRSTFPWNERWTLDASRMDSRPFMREPEPIGFQDLRQYRQVPDDDTGFYRDNRDDILWLRTIEGVWLTADMEAPDYWSLDVNDMPRIDHKHLHRIPLATLQADCADYDGRFTLDGPLDTYDGIAATFGK